MRKYTEVEQHIEVKKQSLCSELHCDVCEKEIKLSNQTSFYRVVSYHYDWGNDSEDSREAFDICSKECLSKHSTDYIRDMHGTENYDIERVSVIDVITYKED